jgi:lipopolysaccharide transport system ATP-binding protein
MDADAGLAVEHYLAQAMAADSAEKVWASDTAPGDEMLRLRAMRVVNESGQIRSEYESGRPVFIQCEFDLLASHPALRIGFDLVSMDGYTIITSFHNDGAESEWPQLRIGRNVLQCEIPPGLLNAGRYRIAPGLGIHKVRWVAREGPVVQFDVKRTRTDSPFWTTHTPGVLAPIWNWRTLV